MAKLFSAVYFVVVIVLFANAANIGREKRQLNETITEVTDIDITLPSNVVEEIDINVLIFERETVVSELKKKRFIVKDYIFTQYVGELATSDEVTLGF